MANQSTQVSPMRRAHGFRLVRPGQSLEPHDFLSPDPGPSEVLIEVAGCGICHTDIGFASGSVPTRHPLPLILGHEISGRVIAAGAEASNWLGRAVIVPAVIPCGACPACVADRPTICRQQFMPGNDGDGGFATQVRVPARGLCPVPEALPDGINLASLSVVADAVTTPYEAIRRSKLGPDHVAIVVGAGGIGGFGVQIAAALGAAVVAVDIDRERLELAARHGASLTVDSSATAPKELKAAVRAFIKASGRAGIGLRIFEMSGTPAGQSTAFNLLDYGAHLAVVGYTAKAVELRLSNLMAFDATAQGNWGCPPEQYPAALQLVLDGKVKLAPLIEQHPLEDAPAVFEAVARHSLHRRAILTPRANDKGGATEAKR
jgi:6-hydroxycyclohex-1-ene-1-carbonyl-CoA dehydrogenase